MDEVLQKLTELETSMNQVALSISASNNVVGSLATSIQQLVLDHKQAAQDVKKSIDEQTKQLIAPLTGKDVINTETMYKMFSLQNKIWGGVVTALLALLTCILNGYVGNPHQGQASAYHQTVTDLARIPPASQPPNNP